MRHLAISLALVSAALLGACSSSSNDDGPTAGTAGTAGASAGAAGASGTSGAAGASGTAAIDPFAPTKDTSEGLVNVAADVSAVLQKGEIEGACAKWFAGGADRRTKLLCGKWMFFYEGFGASGPPAAIMKFLVQNLPDHVGPGFSKMGMVADPSSPEKLPLGLAPGAKLGTLDTVTYTCASCHFARLPDGRYAVGAPNHAYDYGLQTLSFALLPLLVLGSDESNHDPLAVSRVKPMVELLQKDAALKQKLYEVLAPLAQSSSMPPAFPKEAQHHYASWLPGTQDFLIEPLPINDGVHTVSKISALWGIPDAAEMARTGMPHAMLGFTGSTTSFRHFLRGFVDLAGTPSATWPDEKLDPLEEYVLSLRAPKNPSPPPAADVEKGRSLFASKGCISCHAGANASGQRIFTFDEIGTDRAMQQWGDVKVYSGGDQKTGGIKAPRLKGSWAMGRFLHNGSVPTLEGVFCKEGPRGTITEQPFGDMGHDFTCNLAADEKTALIAYLRAN